MKKRYTIAALALCCSAAMAQETYEGAQIATEDINGTARYVGMGGAMDALGADISTIGTNPAGVGMFRKSWIGMSMGLTHLPSSSGESGKTATSFDQVGFVYAMGVGTESNLNFAFNYHKSSNFNQILALTNGLDGASLNKASYIGAVKDYKSSTLDNALDGSFLKDPNTGMRFFNDASGYSFYRDRSGYIGEYDFNISGALNDQVYLGLTVGIKDVHYDNLTEYSEALLRNGITPGSVLPAGYLGFSDNRTITGTGYDLKFGAIFRPIAENPLRIGVSIATPTWYELTSRSYLVVNNRSNNGSGLIYGSKTDVSGSDQVQYKLYTPWKFGVSAGTTFGSTAAVGIGYEYADYGTLDNRNITGGYYDTWNNTYTNNSSSDRTANRHTKNTLTGVHTLKAGAEFKFSPELAVRMGYNYISPMYKNNAARDFSIGTDGIYYSSTMDYTNWKSTDRLTLGLGYTHKKFSIDLAYVFSSQKGDFHPFPNDACLVPGEQVQTTNFANGVNVKNERHQFLMTLGVKL